MKRSESPEPSERLRWLWDRAEREHREATWNALPSDVADVKVSKADVGFLLSKVGDRSGSILASVAALRAVAVICEEDPQWLHEATPVFIRSLRDSNTLLRYTAVKAVWQARALEALDVVKEARAGETIDAICHAMDRAISILERRTGA